MDCTSKAWRGWQRKSCLNATAPDGKRLVLATYRHVLGYHIREIPMVLSEKPMYDVNRLNRKLSQLIGDDTLDEMTSEYDRLFSSVIRILYQGCTQNAESKANVPMVVATLSMLLHHRILKPCRSCSPRP